MFSINQSGVWNAPSMTVLRITTQQTGELVRFSLEGKLGGPWVAEMERAFSASTGKSIVLDLRGLTGADAEGRKLIVHMQSAGAAVQNSSPLQSYNWISAT